MSQTTVGPAPALSTSPGVQTSSNPPAPQPSRRQGQREVIVALIGLLGVLATALISNWDKLFHNVVTAKYSQMYKPTSNFDTEFRYYVDVSGTRATLESWENQFVQAQKMKLLSENPEKAREIAASFDAVVEELPKVDDMIAAMLPAYHKYFTIDELQELNKFYSTDVMQSMVRKLPLLSQDLVPIQQKLLKDFEERLARRLGSIDGQGR